MNASAPPAAPEDRIVVVIDPGHGGRDPGAVSSSGLTEKTITFDTSKRLRDVLAKSGNYEVVFTRDDDSYLVLDARTELARKAGADLFVSIHADAHHDKSLRGASVYTLSEQASDRVARELRDEGDFEIFDVDIADQPPEVGGILMDLAQRETKNQSARFAQLLIPHLSEAAPLLNNTHRRAGYKVLLAPDVPAVLVEIAFMSNVADEKNLRDPAWRQQIAVAIAEGIDDYFEERAVRQTALN
ncbi:MAG: N-acetylmuramoyl-L-alanine amidase [Pseudomonadota bacterium]